VKVLAQDDAHHEKDNRDRGYYDYGYVAPGGGTKNGRLRFLTGR
jgi:hypothetical protein